MQDKPTPSTAVVTLQMLGYVLAFAVPAAIAAMLLPACAPWIVAGAGVLFVAVSAFLFGWEWDDPRWTPEIRQHSRSLIFLMLIVVVGAAISDTVKEPDRWLAHATAVVATVIVVLVLTIPPFYIGRAIQRRRRVLG